MIDILGKLPLTRSIYQSVENMMRFTKAFKTAMLRGTWVGQLVERPTSAQVMSSQFVSSSPTSASLLSACQYRACFDPLSPSLCPSLACGLPKIKTKIDKEDSDASNKGNICSYLPVHTVNGNQAWSDMLTKETTLGNPKKHMCLSIYAHIYTQKRICVWDLNVL